MWKLCFVGSLCCSLRVFVSLYVQIVLSVLYYHALRNWIESNHETRGVMLWSHEIHFLFASLVLLARLCWAHEIPLEFIMNLSSPKRVRSPPPLPHWKFPAVFISNIIGSFLNILYRNDDVVAALMLGRSQSTPVDFEIIRNTHETFHDLSIFNAACGPSWN